MENVKLLSKKEYDAIGTMLLELIEKCPYIPERLKKTGIKYQRIESGESIGIFTLPGARYLKQYVNGNYEAQISFQVAYKSSPTGNSEYVERQAVVDNIMTWLEEVEDLPALTGGRQIESIEASNSAAYKDETGSDNSVTFAADATMKYFKKGE